MGLYNSFMNSTIICSGNKEVDLDALNLVASGAYDCLCACSYTNEKGHHRFAYATEALMPFVHIRAGLTFEEGVALLSDGLSAIRLAQNENLVLDNFRLSKEYIFCAQNKYKFVYIPIVHRSHVHIKDVLMKLLGAIHLKDERISNLKKNIRNAKSDSEMLELVDAFARSFVTADGFEGEAETSVLNSAQLNAMPGSDEGETTVLSQVAVAAEEGETTVLSQMVVETEEGETSLLSQPGQDGLAENEDHRTVYSENASERLTAFVENDFLESETTVLSSQPQESQHTVITRENSAELLTLVRNSTGEKIPVEITPFTIGKEQQSVDYAVDNYSVSRHHATIIFEDGSYYIIDNGSTNGTVIEGVRLQPGEKAELGNGYIISIGNETFQALLERR